MAHFSESLCEEVIRTAGGCGLSRNEITQMARFALRAIRAENPLMRDYLRYQTLRQASQDPPSAFIAMRAMDPAHVVVQLTGEHADRHIDALMSGNGTEAGSIPVAANDAPR